MSAAPPNHLNRGVQRLPFTIAPLTTSSQLREVLELRNQAYSRHDYKDSLKRSMLRPDGTDLSGNATTLGAVCKETGSVLGTVRIMSSMDGEVDFPEGMPSDPCLATVYAYIDRFAVAGGSHATHVASALMKATWLWALGRDSRWLVALALAPLARVYRRRGGLIPRAGGHPILMDDYHTEPYLLLGATLDEARSRLQQENPKYVAEFIDHVHPDICVHGMSIPWSQAQAPRLELVRG